MERRRGKEYFKLGAIERVETQGECCDNDFHGLCPETELMDQAPFPENGQDMWSIFACDHADEGAPWSK